MTCVPIPIRELNDCRNEHPQRVITIEDIEALFNQIIPADQTATVRCIHCGKKIKNMKQLQAHKCFKK